MSKGKKCIKRIALVIACISALLLVSIGALSVYAKGHVDHALDDALFVSAKSEGSIRLYTRQKQGDEDALVLYEEIFLSGSRRRNVSIDEVPNSILYAFLAAEDRRFYEHHGVNIGRTLLAALNYLTKTHASFGASTITQQVVKNISGDSEVTLSRKLNEILRAIHMEQAHSKDEILELYLNIVPMSENMLGIGQASRVYFGKEVGELSYAEAATLAGIANAPTRYNPYLNPAACREKRDRVLYAMHDAGYLSEEEYKDARAQPLLLCERQSREQTVMSWFAETVLKDIERDLVERAHMTPEAAHRYVMYGGFSVEVTVDPEVQHTLQTHVDTLSSAPDAVSYAMCICDSQTGELVAIVGRQGEKVADRISNLATDTPHTPGSVLKPLALYAPLLEEKRINAATVFDDVPVEFHRDGASYTAYPRNSPAIYQGLTTVTDAVRTSKNTVALRLYSMRGAEAIFHTLRSDFGFDTVTRAAYTKSGEKVTDLAPAPLALGQLSYGVTLRALTEAYTVFPSEGILHTPCSYRRVIGEDGRVILLNEVKEKRVYSKECARIMNTLLSTVTDSGTAKSIQLKYTVDTAGKTGTSGDDRDRWFVGYTPYYTAGIWCGYESGGRSIGRIAPSHLALWDAVMTDIHKTRVLNEKNGVRSFSVEGLQRMAYCMDSGERFTVTCSYDPRGSRMAYGYFTADNAPRNSCTCHIPVAYDALTQAIAHGGCPREELTVVSLLGGVERDFPMQVYVSDAQYVYRSPTRGAPLGDSYDTPFFIHSIENGHFCGISMTRKQFNAACYLHDLPRDEEEGEEISSA